MLGLMHKMVAIDVNYDNNNTIMLSAVHLASLDRINVHIMQTNSLKTAAEDMHCELLSYLLQMKAELVFFCLFPSFHPSTPTHVSN